MQEILIELCHPDAVMPHKTNENDSGYDLVATSLTWNDDYGFYEYGLGIKSVIPVGYHVEIRMRSSVSKYNMFLCNGVATIDNTYRGEWKLRFKVINENDNNNLINIYTTGDKIAQMFLRKDEDTKLTGVKSVAGYATKRGEGGFGSTDNYTNGEATDRKGTTSNT